MNTHHAPASWQPGSGQAAAYAIDPLRYPQPRTEEIRFRHLTTPQAIAGVLHLREELSLPDAVRQDPAFVALEKKETRWGLWVLSNCTASSSAPSASSRSVADLRPATPSSKGCRNWHPRCMTMAGRWGGSFWHPRTAPSQKS